MPTISQLHGSALTVIPSDGEFLLGVPSDSSRVFAAVKATAVIPAGNASGMQVMAPSGTAGQAILLALSTSFSVSNGTLGLAFASTTIAGVMKVDGTTITVNAQTGVASVIGGGGGSATLASGTGDNPVMDGVVNVGTSAHAARADHVHPVDTSREAATNKNQANGYAGLDSNAKVPVSLLPTSVVGAMNYQGTWNALTNNPVLTSGSGSKGFFYTVATAGTTTVDGISQWNIGDKIVFNGATWEKIDGIASEVISVVGLTGTVTAAQVATALGLGDLATIGRGTTGYVLTSTGAGSPPTWQVAGAASVPIATPTQLGGIKPDGVTLQVNSSTGVASVIGKAVTDLTAAGALALTDRDTVNRNTGDYQTTLQDRWTLYLATGGTFSKRVSVAPVAIAYSAVVAIDASLGNTFRIGTLTGACTVSNPTNLTVDNQEISLRLKQDGTGGRTVTLGPKWVLRTGDSIPTAANAVFRIDGTYDLADDKIRAGVTSWAS